MLATIINEIHLIFLRTQQHPKFVPNTVVNFVIKKSVWSLYCIHFAIIKSHLKKTVRHNPHNSSEGDSRITRQYGYKNTLCQIVMSTKKSFFQYFSKNTKSLIVSLPRIVQVFSLSCKIVCRWVTTDFCFMNYIFPLSHFITQHCKMEFLL